MHAGQELRSYQEAEARKEDYYGRSRRWGTFTACTCLLRVRNNLSHSNVCTNRICSLSGKFIALYTNIFTNVKKNCRFCNVWSIDEKEILNPLWIGAWEKIGFAT
jgi:hypothetical protein